MQKLHGYKIRPFMTYYEHILLFFCQATDMSAYETKEKANAPEFPTVVVSNLMSSCHVHTRKYTFHVFFGIMCHLFSY
jgi:hypothetical protein